MELFMLLKHFLHHVNYGESLCKGRLMDIIRGYESSVKDKRIHKKWYDAAYLEGYLIGHYYPLFDENEIEQFPYYLDFGMDREFRTFEKFKESIENVKGRKKPISEYATRLVSKIPDDSITCQHTPFL